MERALARSRDRFPDSRSTGRTIRLMIVDDSTVARAVLSRMVETDPAFEITAVAGTAEDAIEALGECRVDIVVLDLEMPGAGGLKSIPRILAAAGGAKVMIVSSLAEDGAEQTVAALALGAADTMPKPGTGRFNGKFSEVLVTKLRGLGYASVELPQPKRLHAVGRSDVRVGRRHLWRRRRRCCADRNGPRWRRRRVATGRQRRFYPRPGRGELRRMGHAARDPRSGPRLRCTAAGQDRPAHCLAYGGAVAVPISDSFSRILAGLLEARTGQQLTMSRRWRLETALSALLRERGIATLDELITILVMGKEPSLSQKVVEALLNNETYFFRDRAPFDMLQRHAIPDLAKRRHGKKRLRIWSAGCSTGQEVYSLAMLFAEAPELWRGWTIDILGTDVSTSCIDRSRSGTYSQFEVQRGLGINQMIKWFEEVGD